MTRGSTGVVAAQSAVRPGTDLPRHARLMAAVHDAVIYRPGVTDSSTTAADALALGAGVCQDKTHLFIASARAAGIPARYVVGYLMDEEAPLAEGEREAGAAHVDLTSGRV